MYSENIKEHFTIRQGRYFWLFVALLAIFLLYMIVDCFNLFGASASSSDDDCGCDPYGSVALSETEAFI